MSRYWRPQDMVHQCMTCGKWSTGPFQGQRDVPLDEVNAYFSRVMRQPVQGRYEPATEHPEHPRWIPPDAGETPYSGGSCAECNQEQLDRLARLREMSKPAPEEPPGATGTDGQSGEGESNG